jgi:hypothetical protein
VALSGALKLVVCDVLCSRIRLEDLRKGVNGESKLQSENRIPRRTGPNDTCRLALVPIAADTFAPNDSCPHVTELLLAWGSGDRSALDELVPIVHEELRRLARLQMRGERDNHTLQTTALVNEHSFVSSTFAASGGRTGRTFWHSRRV